MDILFHISYHTISEHEMQWTLDPDTSLIQYTCFSGLFCYDMEVMMIEDTAIINSSNNEAAREKSSAQDPEIEAMMKAGVHFGHAKTKNHPSMSPYFFGTRNTITLLDLVKTKEKLHEAQTFLSVCVKNGGVVLLVGTRPAGRLVVKEMAEKTQMPYIAERWIGGLLTNFKVVAKRIAYMQFLQQEKESGGLQKYTKKEIMQKDAERVRLEKYFGGVRQLTKLPNALFVIDVIHDSTAVREAKRLGIPVVALADTNSDIRDIMYPIPANDDALPALRFMTGEIVSAITEGVRNRVSEAIPRENTKESQ